MSFELNPCRSVKPVSWSNLERTASKYYPITRSFEGKGHSVANNVKVSLTLVAPITRQMETSSSIAPNTATTACRATSSETDTHRNVRLAFGEM
jgi:hypothetical protein